MPVETFFKESEDARVIEKRDSLILYRVMIWVQDGLITIPTTLIIRSCTVGFANLECFSGLAESRR